MHRSSRLRCKPCTLIDMTPAVEEFVAEVQRTRALVDPATAREVRQTAGVTQTRLARALEVDRTTLARWETGTSRPHQAQHVAWTGVIDVLRQIVEEAAA